MIASRDLAARFEAYSDWRRRLAASVSSLNDWLREQALADARIDARLRHLPQRLENDKLVVAFVAEFSRGKSELINAIFFADFGRRLLPSSAGRTTMCPTELLHDPSQPPSIRLLPIETQLRHSSVAEMKAFDDEWLTLPLDLAAPEQMGNALQRVSQVKRVPVQMAANYGLHGSRGAGNASDGEDMVDIPCWRHAIINFPHPLLQQGLVILDTPGLNAVGIEPELTLNQIPDAHAVLFVVAADAGVTRSDLEVWKRHLAAEEAVAGRIVILNKIDGLWDDLKSEAAIDAEISQQAAASAQMLGVPHEQVFPVSAQKALIAKINGDAPLLARSRLPALESALSGTVIPAKRDLVGSAIQAEVRAVAALVQANLEVRRDSIRAQLGELRNLRGKNREVVEHMMARVHEEKLAFERGQQRYTALRNVFNAHATRLFDGIGIDALHASAGRTRREIEESVFTQGIRDAMNAFFATIRDDFARAARESVELQDMMSAMYARFAEDRGLEAFLPPPFSMLKYEKEIERLERAYATQFDTVWNLATTAKFALMRRFFETIAFRVKHVYDIANRDVDGWLRAVMAPLEGQVKEHQLQLHHRLESIRSIHQASDELVVRVAELERAEESLSAQLAALDEGLQEIDGIVAQPDRMPLAANG